MLNWDIYLAAPSGKAADRMRESIMENIEKITDNTQNSIEALERIKSLESYTIHRLLRFDPTKNAFSRNEKNPFDPHSIFILDEASMIDISLFGAMLAAIPTGAKVYIMGDPDQLPSVDAGAVLGDLLRVDQPYVIKLLESNRFDDKSNIGKLSKNISTNTARMSFTNVNKLPSNPWGEIQNINSETPLDIVQGFRLSDDSGQSTYSEQKKQIEKILKRWTDRFYKDLHGLAQNIEPTGDFNEQSEALNTLWNASLCARILSAERQGLRGTEQLNRAVRIQLKQKASGFFSGQLLMLTRNQTMLKLYNGDSGIVVYSNKDNQYYLLLKKPHIVDNKRLDFTAYPLSMLPSDAI